MPKVAIIEPVGGHGGMDYYDFGLSDGLAAAGVDVTLHTCEKTTFTSVGKFSVRHSYAGVYGKNAALLRGFLFVLGTLGALTSAVVHRRKIIHFHFFRVGALSLMNVVLARLALRKVVITAHDVESFVSSLEVPFMSRLAYRIAHRVIAHNNISRDELNRRLRVPTEKIAVIPHGNYLHALQPMPSVETAREKLGIPSTSKVLLFFGQIKEVKGLDVLLKAIPEVLNRHPDTKLLIAGKPWKTNFTHYQGQIDELGIGNSCYTHIHYIKDEDVPTYYAAADVVVLPYRHIYQSGVVLMAMSYGKPVLVSDIPGMTEIVSDNISGYVFQQGNVTDLARKINMIFSDSKTMTKISENGLQVVRQKYDWREIGNATRRLYESLLD